MWETVWASFIIELDTSQVSFAFFSLYIRLGVYAHAVVQLTVRSYVNFRITRYRFDWVSSFRSYGFYTLDVYGVYATTNFLSVVGRVWYTSSFQSYEFSIVDVNATTSLARVYSRFVPVFQILHRRRPHRHQLQYHL
ncbi:hypothetical protein HDV64DRAFT_167632 [Trichoderma sp. TUCIM 5745]